MTDQFIYCSITGATILPSPNGHEGFYFSDEYGKTYYLSALAWRMWDLLPQKASHSHIFQNNCILDTTGHIVEIHMVALKMVSSMTL